MTKRVSGYPTKTGFYGTKFVLTDNYGLTIIGVKPLRSESLDRKLVQFQQVSAISIDKLISLAKIGIMMSEQKRNLAIDGVKRPVCGPYPKGVFNGPDPTTKRGRRRRKKNLGL